MKVNSPSCLNRKSLKILFIVGLSTLARGLRTNISLRQLHLQFCNLTSEAGEHLSDILANSRTALQVLNVSGNRLGGRGLKTMCKGLNVNTKCEVLLLADNMIDQTEEDIEGLTAFKDCLNNPNVNLNTIDLMYNRIGRLNILCENLDSFIKCLFYD